MFFRRRRNRAEIPPTPQWFRWGLLAFVAYLFFSYSLQKPPAPTPGEEPGGLQWDQLQVLNEGVQQVMPLVGSGTSSVRDIKQGDGLPLLCGQEVTVQYRGKPQASTGDAAVTRNEKTFTFTLGSASDLVLQRAVTGMRIGGERAVKLVGTLPENIPDPEFVLTLHAAVPDATPLFPDAARELPLRLFDQLPGAGAGAQCGDAVRVHIVVWGEDGKRVESTREGEPLTFTIGWSQVPLGLEQGVIGMQPGGKRTLIIPPAWQKPLKSGENAPEAAKLRLENTSVMDIELLPQESRESTVDSR